MMKNLKTDLVKNRYKFNHPIKSVEAINIFKLIYL